MATVWYFPCAPIPWPSNLLAGVNLKADEGSDKIIKRAIHRYVRQIQFLANSC